MKSILRAVLVMTCLGGAACSAAETPVSSLLVLNKGDNALAIIDPETKAVVARVPAGGDPHEVVASADGKLAFVSNYSGRNTISVIDLVGQKALPPVSLGALHSPHGLAEAQGKIYFTAEDNKIVGRFDPARMVIDWLLGLGQERTHMIVVSKDAKKVYTSNVNSDTISLIEEGARMGGPGGPGGFGGPSGPPSGGPDDGQGPPDGRGGRGGRRGGPGGPDDFGGPGGPPPGGPDDGQGPPDGRGGRGGRGVFGGPPPGGPGGRGGWLSAHVAVGKGPEGFDVSPDGKEVWSANSHDGTVSVIDAGKKSVVATVNVGTRSSNRLKFTLDGKYVLVSDLGGRDLVVVETTGRAVVKKIKLPGGAAGILMNPDGTRAYVAVGSANGLMVIDLQTLELSGKVESGRGPDGLGWAVRR